jgi:hypothetical protein
MRERASAYAALELDPGADQAAIEQAYRRLIKRYHPDRSGGDVGRAAEINRAYLELRKGDEPQRVVAAPSPRSSRPPVMRPRRRRRSLLWPVLAIAVVVLILVQRDRPIAEASRWLSGLADADVSLPSSGRGSAVQADSAAIDGPLSEAIIAGAISEAAELARNGDEVALAQASRDCHRRMRQQPDLAQLDRCAAFDDAVLAALDSDRMSAGGAFGAAAVTARQMTAGRLLSSDYLAIERRLDRIRTMVEMTLMPPPSPPPVIADEEPAGA